MRIGHDGRTFLGSRELGKVLDDLGPIRCLDVGSRFGPTRDLYPMGPAVEMLAFEADPEECARLERVLAGRTPYRSVRFLPVALAGAEGTRTLHLTRQRSSSTILEPLPSRTAPFGRHDRLEVERTVEVRTRPLDPCLAEHGASDARYLKMDVEGAELEILRSAPGLLAGSLLVIRTEVYFHPIHSGQPDYTEIASFLREHAFVPMGFLELQHWRRCTRQPHPELVEGPVPYSRGQIVHGDALFFRDPESMRDSTDEEILALVTAAFFAMTYEYMDHALYLLGRPPVRERLASRYGFAVEDALRLASLHVAGRYRREQLRLQLGRLKAAIPLVGRIPLRALLQRARLAGHSSRGWEYDVNDPTA